MSRLVMICAALIVSFAAFVNGAEKHAAITDVKQAAADPDYSFQGEYSGELGDEKWGIQVIALGAGKFHGVGYRGGLPGDGWDGERKVERDGTAQNGEVAFVSDTGGKAVVKDGVISAFIADGDKIGELTRILRGPPTLGAKPGD